MRDPSLGTRSSFRFVSPALRGWFTVNNCHHDSSCKVSTANADWFVFLCADNDGKAFFKVVQRVVHAFIT